MTEARKPMAKKRGISTNNPEEKAKAFVEAVRRRESVGSSSRSDLGSIKVVTQEEQELARKKVAQVCEDAARIHISKEIARLDGITLELKKQIDNLNRELNTLQVIYNNNFAGIEEALKSSWSYKIRSFCGF